MNLPFVKYMQLYHIGTLNTSMIKLKYLCGIIAHISQMVDSYILKFNNATLRTVAAATNDCFDLK